MKKQVIQNFLNLPGIVGLGLMDGHSRPYFCGIDKSLNFQQKEALTQGIQQVISTTPAGFEAFDFHFSHRDAHIYKLINGVILLVVTHEGLDTLAYQEAIEQLKQTLETDPHSAVSTFRLLAGGTTLTTQQYWSEPQGEGQSDEAPPSVNPSGALPTADPAAKSIHWSQIILALNTLTDATAQYLGKIVVANTWRSTRPDDDPISGLQIDRSGHFSFSADTPTDGNTLVSSADSVALNQWIRKFIHRCEMIIRDYPEMVVRQSLTEQQRVILGIDSPGDTANPAR